MAEEITIKECGSDKDPEQDCCMPASGSVLFQECLMTFSLFQA